MKAILKNHGILDEESNIGQRNRIKQTNHVPTNEKRSFSSREALLVLVNNKLTQVFI